MNKVEKFCSDSMCVTATTDEKLELNGVSLTEMNGIGVPVTLQCTPMTTVVMRTRGACEPHLVIRVGKEIQKLG